jgi:methionyl aminopeptidase
MLTSRYAKSTEQIERMRVAGRLAARTLEYIADFVRAGTSTLALDRLCHDFIAEHGGESACVGYNGYQHTICASVNHVVCHGIPNDRPLKNGDIVNIDVVVRKEGVHGDTSRTFMVGTVSAPAQRLVEVGQQCLYRGMAAARPGATLGDVGHAIWKHADTHGYSVVREFVGHGIGEKMHEEPEVQHIGRPGTGVMLVPGMTFTIEPMINAGRRDVRVLPDGWTVVTRDRSLSAQWEHTVLITATGCEALTARCDERGLPG